MRLRVSAALAALAALTGCADFDRFEPRDPTVSVRRTLDEHQPLRGPAAGAPREIAPEAAEQRAIRGFIRRGAPAGAVEAPPRGERPIEGAAEISLDFEDADLASVVRVIMEEGLRANYILDPSVSGRVTLRTNRPLRNAELLPTLEEILRLNNAAVVRSNGVYRIVPRAEAGQSAPLMTSRDISGRGLTVRVTPLRFVGVEDVREVLDGFAPVAGAIRYNPARNLVFTIGTSAEQATIMDVLATLDVNYFAGRSFALRPLREADPQILVDELTQAFAPPSGEANAAIRFLGVDRMNAVLVISDDPTLLDEAVALIRNLDQGAGETPRLYVFPVTERRASDLAQILGDIFSAPVSGAQPTQDRFPDGFATASESLRAQGTDDGADQDAAAATAPPPARPDPALVAIAALAGGGAPAASGAASGLQSGIGQGGVHRIVADESSNSVVALATADGARALGNALRQLDVQPLQVMIEATLVEVALNDTLEYGVRWFFETGSFDFGFNTPAAAGLSTVGDLLPGVSAAFRTEDAAATIQALDEVTDVAILSAPTLMVLDNEVARLQIGDQVPVTVRSTQSTLDSDAPIVTEEEFRDTGISLQIRPTVNAGGNVILQVRQEATDVVESADATNPTFQQRVIESTIAVQSGDTIAIAGLIEEDNSDARAGVPVLSRLPLIGPAFGVTTQNTGRSELLVLIRPIVIRDQSSARAATEELRRKLTALAPAAPAVDATTPTE